MSGNIEPSHVDQLNTTLRPGQNIVVLMRHIMLDLVRSDLVSLAVTFGLLYKKGQSPCTRPLHTPSDEKLIPRCHNLEQGFDSGTVFGISAKLPPRTVQRENHPWSHKLSFTSHAEFQLTQHLPRESLSAGGVCVVTQLSDEIAVRLE